MNKYTEKENKYRNEDSLEMAIQDLEMELSCQEDSDDLLNFGAGPRRDIGPRV